MQWVQIKPTIIADDTMYYPEYPALSKKEGDTRGGGLWAWRSSDTVLV